MGALEVEGPSGSLDGPVNETAADAAEVVEVYRGFNRLHAEALDERTSSERRLEILDQMESIVSTVKAHVARWSRKR